MTLSHLVGYARCKYNVERETRWQVVILGHGSDTWWRVQLDPTPLLEYLRSKNAHKVGHPSCSWYHQSSGWVLIHASMVKSQLFADLVQHVSFKPREIVRKFQSRVISLSKKEKNLCFPFFYWNQKATISPSLHSSKHPSSFTPRARSYLYVRTYNKWGVICWKF